MLKHLKIFFFLSLLIIFIIVFQIIIIRYPFFPKTTVNFKPGIGFIHEWKIINNCIYAVTNTAPAKLVKINPNTLAEESILVFPSDNKHDFAFDFTYIKNKNKIYIVFGKRNTSISEVNLKNMTHKDIFYFETKKFRRNNAPSITSDSNYIYVISTTPRSIIHKISLNNYKIVQAKRLDSLGFGHTIRYTDGWLFATGPGKSGWIAKINPKDLSFTYRFLNNIKGWPTDDLAITNDSIFVCIENKQGYIYKINKKDLSVKSFPTGVPAECYGVYSDARYVWALFETKPGIIIKINPIRSSITKIHLNKGDDFPNEIISDNKFIYISYWVLPGKVSKIIK